MQRECETVSGYLTRHPWQWFAIVQVAQLGAWFVGLFVLIVPCYRHSWAAGAKSIKDGRLIDSWTSPWLQWFHNPEDGDSGQFAIVQGQPYLPNASAGWRAYSWSALRNSADGLKYYFAWDEGPLVTWTWFGHDFQAGWKLENGAKVPVLS